MLPPVVSRTEVNRMVTIESLQEKLKGLKDQLEQLQANANVLVGAIRFAESLIQEDQEAIKQPPVDVAEGSKD